MMQGISLRDATLTAPWLTGTQLPPQRPYAPAVRPGPAGLTPSVRQALPYRQCLQSQCQNSQGPHRRPPRHKAGCARHWRIALCNCRSGYESAGARGKGKQAGKGAAAGQAALSRTVAGILKVTLPEDAGPAALHAAMKAALKAYSTAVMPALLPLAHSMPRSHGHDVTRTRCRLGNCAVRAVQTCSLRLVCTVCPHGKRPYRMEWHWFYQTLYKIL